MAPPGAVGLPLPLAASLGLPLAASLGLPLAACLPQAAGLPLAAGALSVATSLGLLPCIRPPRCPPWPPATLLAVAIANNVVVIIFVL
mgnify:CR=1 FL=1